MFSKFASTITNPNDPIIFNPETKELDFEVELAIVIGKKAKHITVRLCADDVVAFSREPGRTCDGIRCWVHRGTRCERARLAA